ncbi:MAG: glutamate-1-semialdehyde 2,1-aminomutase [Planctomycetes bacterium]|nr:glutamate-1-semialdehyde 2,1-aminomutase [Planctomycetota bacterium]
MKNAASARWFRRAVRRIPGGVNSPVRAFRAVGGTPPFIRRARGAGIEDADGNRYVDYVGSWGPLILGHAHPAVLRAIREAAARGTSYGAPHAGEVEMAELLAGALPSLERLRLVSSGTEACMSAIRVARGFTKRDGIVKFEGGYHGHADFLLVRAGSGAATFGVPGSAGVPKEAAAKTATLPYNDARAAEAFLRRNGTKIACVIVEPVAGNMGVVPPAAGFLETLRRETERCGTLLIFDEVITGFRLCWGGAQTLFGIRPDLTTLGKIVGGGLPLGAYGGRADVMKTVSPEGPVYQAGTLSGNPVAVAAGLAQLRALRGSGVYAKLDGLGRRLEEGLRALGLTVNRAGSALTPFFCDGPVTDWTSASRCDTKRFARFFHGMLDRGFYLPPSQFEAMFVGAAHTPAMIERTLRAAAEVLRVR